MIWCEKDDCECHRPECADHGCMDACETCGGSGFSGRGTGYDDVCSECGGLQYFPNRSNPMTPEAIKELAHSIADASPEENIREENRMLRERLGPQGLEVVFIGDVGHYVNEKIKAEIERLREELAAAKTSDATTI